MAALTHNNSRLVSLCAWLLMTLFSLAAQCQQTGAEVIVVQGAPGAEEYARRFAQQVNLWQEACKEAGLTCQVVGVAASDPKVNDLEALRTVLQQAAAKPTGRLWLAWVGHGTFDGREAKFNLRGPDVSARQVAEWLAECKRELVVVQASSASAPFLTALARPNRIIVSATKGADEVFYARFGEYFAPAIAGQAEADLDQDNQVSVLEAFLYASKRTAQFYEEDGRLATEHALIEDNGDGNGTRAEVFVGVKPVNATDPAKADGARAAKVALVLSREEAALPEAVRAKRDALEIQLEELKSRRQKLGEEAFYTELEKVLRELAALYPSDT